MTVHGEPGREPDDREIMLLKLQLMLILVNAYVETLRALLEAV